MGPRAHLTYCLTFDLISDGQRLALSETLLVMLHFQELEEGVDLRLRVGPPERAAFDPLWPGDFLTEHLHCHRALQTFEDSCPRFQSLKRISYIR